MANKRRVKCKKCGFLAHDLTEHLKNTHKMTPEQYQGEYEDARILSSFAENQIEVAAPMECGVPMDAVVISQKGHANSLVEEMLPARPMIGRSFSDIFGFPLYKKVRNEQTGRTELDTTGHPVYDLDSAGNKIILDFPIPCFTEPGPMTPAIDPGYVFDEESLLLFLVGVDTKENMLLTGHTGTGKTSFIEQVAARMNMNVVKISFDGNLAREDLVGCFISKGRETVFQESVLPYAMRLPGTIILLDEWDTISSECSFVLQSVLQSDYRMLQLFENGGMRIPMHRQNFVAATANTLGMGDMTGLYAQGTSPQNYSQLNRFALSFIFDYLEPEKEKELLRKKIVDGEGNQLLEDFEVDAFIKAATSIRKAFEKGDISCPVSPRDLLNWAQKFTVLGHPMRAARYCFLNRLETVDRQAVESLIQHVFGSATRSA